MILNLRGTSGSGKSYVGHALLEEFPHEEIYEEGWLKSGKPKLIGYRLPGNLVILGSYRAAGGGLDCFFGNDRSKALSLIEKWIPRGHHLYFEALVLSTMVPRFIEMLERTPVPRDEFVFAFLDTPLDICIKRIYQRNGGKPIKEYAVRGHHRQVKNVERRLREDHGRRTETVGFTRAYEQVKELLRSGGWNPVEDSGDLVRVGQLSVSKNLAGGLGW